MSEEAAEDKKGKKGKGEGGGKSPVGLLIVIVLLMNTLVVGKIFFGGSKEKAGGEDKHAKKVEEVGKKFPLEQFLINLAGEGDHYITTTITLGLKKGVEEKKFEEEVAPCRDAIVTILSEKSLQQVSTLEGKEKLKEEIKETINKELGETMVVKVYFTAFATQ
jgi:flagellar FliL protein